MLYDLMKKNLMDCISIYDPLLNYNNFLQRTITGNKNMDCLQQCGMEKSCRKSNELTLNIPKAFKEKKNDVYLVG